MELSDRQKKIILLSLSGQLGGTEIRMADEASLLKAQGYDPEIWINMHENLACWADNISASGTAVIDFSPPLFFESQQFKRINKKRAELFYAKKLQESHADLAHIFWPWLETGGTRLWLAHYANIPAVISVHCSFPDYKYDRWRAKILQQCFTNVKGLYAVSETTLEDYLQVYGTYLPKNIPVEVIHNFVDTNRFNPGQLSNNDIKKQLGIPASAFVIGSVARLVTQKYPEFILEVFSKVVEVNPDVVLVFVGDGPLKAKIKAMTATKGLGNKVFFASFSSSIEDYFSIFDLHLLASRFEGFGIVTAEAMACGVPVMGSNVAGTKDILASSNAGVLYPFDDHEQATSILLDLINDPDKLQIMSTAGPLEVEKRFTRNLWVEKINNFYKKVFSLLDEGA